LKRIRRLQLALVREREKQWESRQRLARAWTAWLNLALESRLEDGTSVLALTLEINPDLRRRLEAAMRGRTHE
jgi:hypothetical protein